MYSVAQDPSFLLSCLNPICMERRFGAVRMKGRTDKRKVMNEYWWLELTIANS